MKSENLKIGDKLLITEAFMTEMKRQNPLTAHVWMMFKSATVDELSVFSTVNVSAYPFSVWIDNNLAENMRKAYLDETKDYSSTSND